jgi:predicted nuclease with TOPRIM domain
MTALGSDNTTIKGNAEEGRVTLTVGDATYTRRLRREGNDVTTGGDPYLEDPALVDLFAFLLESNEARQAVARGEDLRDVIMRPVDTADIETEIEKLQSEREEMADRIEEIPRLKQQLTDLEKTRTEIRSELDDKRSELSAVEAELAEMDADDVSGSDDSPELERKLEELGDVRSDLESVRRRIESERESISALQEEREDLQDEREEYEKIPEHRIHSLKDDVQQLRDEKNRLDDAVNELQTVIEFNEDLLDGDSDVFSELLDEDSDGAPTDRLVETEDDLICWTCGSETTSAEVESMLEDLHDLRDRYMSRRGELKSRIEERKEDHHRLEEKKRQREQIDVQIDNIADEIDDRETRLSELTDRRETLSDRVDALEDEVERLRTDDGPDDELLDRHREANRLEVEVERLEANLEQVEDEMTDLKAEIEDREALETQREEIRAEIDGLRTRVERLETDAIEQFNEHMDAVLNVLDYGNIERIWIERTEEDVRDGRRVVTRGRFDLHVVRSTDSGGVYEDTVDHLSESEREVTGLVFALAGYLVHDVYEQVPFMLLDSVEAIDAPRIAALVEYFETYADYLVVALLEEDAQALDDSYQRRTEF